jgi:hypothetical protein
VEYVEATHAFVASYNVGGGVAFRVADVETSTTVKREGEKEREEFYLD